MKYLLALLVAVLLTPLSQAATSTTIFSGVTTGPTVNLRPNQFVQAGTYQVTGTGVATLEWQYSSDQTNWATLASYTAAAGPITFANPGFYRFSCTDFTSGTLTGIIVTPYFVYQQTTGPSGAVVFQVDDGGVTSSLFTGPTSGGGSSVFAALTITGTAANSVTNAGGYTSTHATGVAPFTATSTTVCPNLNASLLNGATFAAPGAIGGTTPAAITGTTVTGTTLVSTVATGTPPLTVASTDVVANLHAANSDQLGGATFAAPGAIGGGTPAAITGTTVTGSTLVSTIAIGTAPLTVTSTTNVANLNASSLSGATFAAPGAIGGGTASTGAFTTVTGTLSPTFGTGLALINLVLNGAAGTSRDFRIQSGGSLRWFFGADNTAESGGDAGSNWFMTARTDAGGNIDSPIQINRVAGGTMTLSRPVLTTSTTEASAANTASVVHSGGLGVVKRSFLGTIGSTFKGNVEAGVQDGTADTAGAVGEVIQGTNQSSYTNFTTDNALQQLAVLTSLPPGRYRLEAIVTYSGNAATNAALADAQFAISTTTASIAGAVEGRSIGYITEEITSSTHKTISFSTDVNISAATSQFLNGKARFAAGNPQYVASLTAYRLR